MVVISHALQLADTLLIKIKQKKKRLRARPINTEWFKRNHSSTIVTTVHISLTWWLLFLFFSGKRQHRWRRVSYRNRVQPKLLKAILWSSFAKLLAILNPRYFWNKLSFCVIFKIYLFIVKRQVIWLRDWLNVSRWFQVFFLFPPLVRKDGGDNVTPPWTRLAMIVAWPSSSIFR